MVADKRTWYVIHRGIIRSRTYGFQARRYTGPNPHTGHIHISIDQNGADVKSTASWGIGKTPAPPVPRPPVGDTYAVKAGDNLGLIAQRTGVSVAELVRLNDIADPDVIEVGQVLKLKAAGPTPPPVVKPDVKLVLNPDVKPNRTHRQVADLKRFLIRAGYGPIKDPSDFFYGSTTMVAVTKFHRANPQFASSGSDPAIGPRGFLFLQGQANR